MAYDSKTYGQSPFGLKPDDASSSSAKPPESPVAPDSSQPDVLEIQPLADKFPTVPTKRSPESAAVAPAIPVEAVSTTASSPVSTSSRKSRSPNRKSTAKTANRKSKKPRQTKSAKTQTDTPEPVIDWRFTEEDRRAYLSLLYKTGISGLVWAVLRLSRYELSDRAIAIINTLVDPLMIATVTFIAAIALTFWTRRLLNDLAQHTQKLHADAEMTDDKSFRPTLEIVGDALEYNPKFRKNVAALSNTASIVICALVSYLITFALFPTE
ncbi:MAG: hypothetical protein WBB01_20105 [Phormidesmis sp.]